MSVFMELVQGSHNALTVGSLLDGDALRELAWFDSTSDALGIVRLRHRNPGVEDLDKVRPNEEISNEM